MSVDKQTVIDLIKKDKVVIFSKSYCPYCTKAKEAFKKLGKEFYVIELDEKSSEECNAYQDALGEITGKRSVPRVFVDEKFIGGGDDVERMLNNGELAKLFD